MQISRSYSRRYCLHLIGVALISHLHSHSYAYVKLESLNQFIKLSIFVSFHLYRLSEQDVKRTKTIYVPKQSKDETFFDKLHISDTKETPNLEAPIQKSSIARAFDQENTSIEDDGDDEEINNEIPKPLRVLPIDWTIKSRVRILSKTPIVSSNLKSSQEASGMTGFVRCLDISAESSGLDTSNESRFHQNLMYWQYPHLPWLNLVQRNSSSNTKFKMNGPESESLLNDWKDCFKNLFQLLRARQCPYFFVLANQFTVLFRAAGVGGINESHALLTPTTRGFRQSLKDEDIEFTQPLKKSTKEDSTPNTSVDPAHFNENKNPDEDEDDEEDELKFLASLGVATSDIKFKEDIKRRQKEIEDDNGDMSTALIQGVDCQAFFNFLLNAKSTVPKIGRLAGIPPTLLGPVAFLGGSLRRQTVRSSKIRLDSEDFFSIELRGAILPHTLHTLCALLSEIKNSYSLTMVNYPNTVAFTKTSRKLLEDLNRSKTEENINGDSLTECGMNRSITESICRTDADAVNILERLQFDRENGGYTMF